MSAAVMDALTLVRNPFFFCFYCPFIVKLTLVCLLGEECEVGIRQADAQCCKNCYLQTSCDDGNPCTTERCVNGNVRTLNVSFFYINFV